MNPKRLKQQAQDTQGFVPGPLCIYSHRNHEKKKKTPLSLLSFILFLSLFLLCFIFYFSVQYLPISRTQGELKKPCSLKIPAIYSLWKFGIFFFCVHSTNYLQRILAVIKILKLTIGFCCFCIFLITNPFVRMLLSRKVLKVLRYFLRNESKDSCINEAVVVAANSQLAMRTQFEFTKQQRKTVHNLFYWY